MSTLKFLLTFILLSLAVPLSIFAACTETGKLQYTTGEYQFCNGTNWISTKGAVDGACTTAGQMTYDSTDSRMEFCDGTNWYSMKGDNIASCAGTTAGTLRTDSNDVQFCDGTNWYSIAAIPQTGLVSHYRLDGDATDTGPSGYDGTVTNVTFVADSHFGTVARFNNTTSTLTDKITFTQSSLSTFTITYWVKPTAKNICYIVGKNGSGAPYFGLGYKLDIDSLISYFENSTQVDSGAASLPAGWQMHTFVRNGTTLSYYLNGSFISSDTVSSANYIVSQLGGYQNDASSAHVQADLARVRIYNRDLSGTEISSIYDTEKP